MQQWLSRDLALNMQLLKLRARIEPFGRAEGAASSNGAAAAANGECSKAENLVLTQIEENNIEKLALGLIFVDKQFLGSIGVEDLALDGDEVVQFFFKAGAVRGALQPCVSEQD